jgi:hypothetical protein
MYSKSNDLKSKVSEFAWCVKNLVRPLGYSNLGCPCQLMGTGMAFKWSTLSKADLANGNIVEDMKLGPLSLLQCVHWRRVILDGEAGGRWSLHASRSHRGGHHVIRFHRSPRHQK